MQAARKRRKKAHKGSHGSKAKGPSNAEIIVEAAHRWHVPVWVLVAVKLIETGSGSGVGEVSKAGAEGPFQFEPGTAASYGVKDTDNFFESANGAAHYLHDLHKQAGDWSGALEGYNGGPGAIHQGYAYNAEDAKATLKEFGLGKLATAAGPHSQLAAYKEVGLLEEELQHVPELFGNPGALAQPFGKSLGEGKGVPNPLAGGEAVLGGLGDLVGVLTDVQTWIRAAEVIAGAILIYLGLKALTGQGISDLPGATTARAAAKLA